MNPHSHVRGAAVALAEVVLCSSIPTQFAIVGLLTLAGVVNGSELAMPAVVIVSLADTVALVALMVALTRARGESPACLWLGAQPIGPEARRGLLLTPAVFAVVIAVLVTIQRLAPWLHNVPANPLELLAQRGSVDAALLFLVAIVAGGLREELQRAFLLDRFERHLGGRAVGVLVLSTAFGLGHYIQGWDAVITTGVLGAFWSVVYLRRRSSVAPVVSHALFNSVEILRVALRAVGQ